MKILPLFFLGLTCFVAFGEMHSTDIFWNLKMGSDWLHQGLSPFVDHYSYSFAGQPLKFVCWPFQLIAAIFYSLWGPTGIPLMRLFFWGATIAVYFNLLRKNCISKDLQFLVGCLLVLEFIHFGEPGPDLGAFFFTGLCLLFFFQAQQDHSTKNLLKLVGLMFLWTNFHTSSVIGYVIVSFLYIHFFIRYTLERKNLKEWARIGTLGLLTLAVGFLNHDLNHVLWAQLHFVGSQVWKKNILDFFPLDLKQQPVFVNLYLALVVISAIWMLWRRRFAEVGLLIFLLYETFQMRRLLDFLILVSLPFVALALQQILEKLKNKRARAVPGVLLAATFAIFLIGDISELKIKGRLDLATLADMGDVVPYLNKSHYHGKIFADEELGGAVLFYFAPDLRVLVDGRFYVLYPLDFAELYFSSTINDGDFDLIEKKYPSDFVLAPLRKLDFLLERAVNSGTFFVDYVGSKNVLLSAHGAHFPESTVPFLYPECLVKRNPDDIKREFDEAQSILPADSPLRIFLGITATYLSSQDKQKFLMTSHPEALSSVESTRLMAVLAKTQGLNDIALFYYKQMPYRMRRDAFEMAQLLCSLKNCDGAEDELYRVSKNGIQRYEYLRAARLFVEIQEKIGLKIMTKENAEQFRSLLAQEKHYPSPEGQEPDRCAATRPSSGERASP